MKAFYSILLLLIAGACLCSGEEEDPCKKAQQLNSEAARAQEEHKLKLKCLSMKYNIECTQKQLDSATGSSANTYRLSLQNLNSQFERDGCKNLDLNSGSTFFLSSSLLLLPAAILIMALTQR